MANYAELGNELTLGGVTGREILNVIVVDNAYEGDNPDPYVQEIGGLAWLATFEPAVGKDFVKTSFNNNFRYNYASVGGIYNQANDAFIEQPPNEHAVLNDQFKWVAP